MSDISARVYSLAQHYDPGGPIVEVADAVADELARLTAENEALRKALVEIASQHIGDEVEALRAARQAGVTEAEVEAARVAYIREFIVPFALSARQGEEDK